MAEMAVVAEIGKAGNTQSAKPGVEACFSKWDGHLDALEDLVRSYLNDEESMETHGHALLPATRRRRLPQSDYGLQC